MIKKKQATKTDTQEEVDTHPPSQPHDRGSGRKICRIFSSREFKIGVAASLAAILLITILTAYITNFANGGGIHLIGGLLKSEIFNIPLPTSVLDTDGMDRGQYIRGIGDRENINTETITKEIVIEEDVVIFITGNSQGEFDPGKNGKNTGRLICKIIINSLDCALDSESICACKCDPWKFPIPMGTSAFCIKTLSPGTYTIVVKATFYGCIENPRTWMQYVVHRLNPTTISQMKESKNERITIEESPH